MRKLATIRRIIDIQPIPDAEKIEVAQVDGWKVVVKKDDFQIGQLALYIEVDAFVPHELAPFLSKGKELREFNGVKGERLRTVKLRGQISQGLLLPAIDGANEGDDVSEQLGIQKYEAPVSAQLAGQVRGNFPSFIPKTDQERIQNLGKELAEWSQGNLHWEVTEKLDGSSMTVYLYQGEFGVCSRNLDLKEAEGNSFWKVARHYQMEDKLRAIGRNLALQGELIGEGIQKNPYRIHGQDFYLFDIYDIDAGRYLNSFERSSISMFGVNHCPVIGFTKIVDETCNSLLAYAEGKSALCADTEREGLVYKCVEAPLSFKAISNKFLLNQ
tara:strand:+ start:16577 stop:17560 length:984 start_codon:yes stop_codon:yes gene_type:complete